MRACLTGPGGYYNKGDASLFGRSGDFVTSPEVSQVFGELLGVWCVASWQALGSLPNTRLIELGPGRGTLMSDAIRAIQHFPDFKAALSGIHLVEVSSGLRQCQQEALHDCGVNVDWHSHLREVPDGPSLTIAHEFFDALPVRQIQYANGQWCERLVDQNEDENGFRLIVSPTALSRFLALTSTIPGDEKDKLPLVLPDNPKEGDVVEFGSEAAGLMQMIGAKCEKNSAALIVDYGANRNMGDTLQAIHQHERFGPFDSPGMHDLSVHVNFDTLSRAATGLGRSSIVHGPVSQAAFLTEMGIGQRMYKLAEQCDTQEEVDVLQQAYDRLVGEETMGRVYQVCQINPAHSSR